MGWAGKAVRRVHATKMAWSLVAVLVLTTSAAFVSPNVAAASTGTADLFISFVTADPSSVQPGSSTSLRVVIFDAGPDNGSGPATVTFTLPPQLTFQGGADCDAPVGSSVACRTDMGVPMNANRTVAITVHMSSTATGMVGPVTATVSGPDTDPKSSNNDAYNYVGVVTDPGNVTNL